MNSVMKFNKRKQIENLNYFTNEKADISRSQKLIFSLECT